MNQQPAATPTPVRAALFQGPECSGTVAENVASIAAAASAARDLGASLLITPEMSVTGYDIGAALADRAEPGDGPISRSVAEIATATGVTVVYGFAERADDGAVYNTVQVMAPGGTLLARYRKTHLFGDLDRGAFRPGDQLIVQFDHRGIRCGLLICYDVEFPETVRAHADAGTDWLIVPTGLMTPHTVIADRLVGVRALESQMFISYVNRCGRETTLEYVGRSCTVGPDGADLVRAGRTEELMAVSIDPAVLAGSRLEFPYLADRRTDLYADRPIS